MSLRRPARLIGWLVAACLLLAARPGSAYEGDHFAWTYYLALQLGCTERQAYQIASGAYAIDWDPETAPLPGGQDPNFNPARLGFGEYVGYTVHGWMAGGVDSFQILQGTPPERLQRIWQRYHAFSPATLVGVGDEAEVFKAQRKQALFELARRQRNPGPLIHYLQDYHAHYGWEDVRGHALGGHLPDFLSDNPAKARRMTEDTLSWISRFLREVLGQAPKAADRARIQEVLDRLIAVNRAPDGLPNSDQVRNALPTETEILDRLSAGESYLDVIRETLLAVDPEGGYNWYAFKLTVDYAPELGAALTVIREAINEDKRAGRMLGGWRDLLEADPDSAIGWQLLPSRWIVYDYDGDAVVANEAYAVEQLELEVGEPAVAYMPEGDDGPVEVTVRLPYRVRGLVEIPNLPRPLVAEVSEIADFAPTRSFRDLENGGFVFSRTFRRGRAQLAEGIDWRGTIDVYGLEPEVRQVTLRYADAPAPDSTDDLEALVRELEETAAIASGAAARAAGRCAQADEIAAGSASAIAALSARLEELRRLAARGAAESGAPGGGAGFDAGLGEARAAVARAQAAADALAALRDRAGALRDAACDARAASAGELAGVDGAARQRLAELRAAVETLRRLAAAAEVAESAAATGTANDRAGALAGELEGLLGELEARLGRARDLVGSVSADLQLLLAQETRGSSLLEEIVRRLPAAPASADYSTRVDRAFGQLRAAVESAAGCDADVGGRLAEAEERAAALRQELDAVEVPAAAAMPAPGAGAAAAEIASLLADLEAQLAVGELFVESILNRVVDARGCLDAPRPPAGDEDAPTGGEDGSSALPEAENPDGVSPSAESPSAESPSAGGPDAGGPDAGSPQPAGDGWVIEEGVETVDERRTGSPQVTPATQPTGQSTQPAASDGVVEAIAGAQAAFGRCDFAGALAWANRLASLDPGNPFLAANRGRIAELAERQRRAVAELEVARTLIRGGNLERARDALAASARVAPACMTERIATVNGQVIGAIGARREANREGLASGLTSLLGALGQAAAAVQGSRAPSPAVAPPIPRPTAGSATVPGSGTSGSGTSGSGTPSGPTCATLDLRSYLEPIARQAAAEQDPDTERIVWYVEEFSYQGGKFYSLTAAGSRSAERQFALVRQYTAQYGAALATYGPYGTLQAAWGAAVARCSNVIRPQ